MTPSKDKSILARKIAVVVMNGKSGKGKRSKGVVWLMPGCQIRSLRYDGEYKDLPFSFEIPKEKEWQRVWTSKRPETEE